MKLKIAIVVHGRFHAFDLAGALIARGHDVTVFTNYPKWAAARFDLPKSAVRSFWLHGGVARAASKLQNSGISGYPDAFIHSAFSRWAASELQKEEWDVVHVWSGVAEEVLETLNGQAKLKLMMRGSAHIKTQARLLREELVRTGAKQDQPSEWMIRREQREYELCDVIVTLSSFAYDSFLTEGVAAHKVACLPLGANVNSFRPTVDVIEARCARIKAGKALRVLYVGALSYQKGFHDLQVIVQELNSKKFGFRCVGGISREVRKRLQGTSPTLELIGKRPQQELSLWYSKADLFLFPTIQDGYAAVLAQAHASALPVLTTTNSGGPDLITDGRTGWILPIRSPERFIQRLQWCDSHRTELAEMVRNIYEDFQPRDWADVALDFELLCVSRLRTVS